MYFSFFLECVECLSTLGCGVECVGGYWNGGDSAVAIWGLYPFEYRGGGSGFYTSTPYEDLGLMCSYPSPVGSCPLNMAV